MKICAQLTLASIAPRDPAHGGNPHGSVHTAAPFSPRSDSEHPSDESADFESTMCDFGTKLVLSRARTPPEEVYFDLPVTPPYQNFTQGELPFSEDVDSTLPAVSAINARYPAIKDPVDGHGLTKLFEIPDGSVSQRKSVDVVAKSAIVCGSLKLPPEIWMLVIALLPPRTTAHLMQSCYRLSLLASDPVYWKSACRYAGVDCDLVVEQAVLLRSRTHEKQFGLSNDETYRDDTYFIRSMRSLGINNSETLVPQFKKRRFTTSPMPKFTNPESSANTTAPSLSSPRQRRKVISSSLALASPSTSLSWQAVYKNQHQTRTTYLRTPCKFRTNRYAHSHGVTCMGATENGNIITGSWDCTLKVWRIVPARQFNSVLIGKKPEEPLDYRSIGSNGSGSAEGNKIFQEELGHGNWGSSGQNRHPDASSSSCFVKEQWVGDGRVELEQVCVIETSHPVECLSVVGDHVLVGGRGTSSLFVYSLSSRKLLTTLCLNLHNPTPTAQFTAVDSCENIVAASQKDCICVWNLTTRLLVAQVRHLTQSNICTVKLFKDRSGSDIDVIHQQYSASTNSPAASASRWWLIETCALGSVTVWEVLLCSSAQSSNDERAVRVSRAAVSSSPASTRSRASNSHSQPPDLSGPLVFDCVLLGRVNCYGSFATIPGINSTQIRESYPHRPGAIRFPMWDVLCGFKDGNIRGWRVRPTSASSANSVEVVETGCFCSLGDWITWLDEDAVADIVVAGAWDGMIRVWDKRKKALRRSLVSNVKSAVLCLVRVNEILVVGNYNGSLIAFDFGRK